MLVCYTTERTLVNFGSENTRPLKS